MDNKKAQMTLVIPNGFEKNLLNGSPASVQTIISGVNTNVASSLQYYAQQIVEKFNEDRLKEAGSTQTLKPAGPFLLRSSSI